MSRHFTIVGSDIGFEGGRYGTDKSGFPKSAAKRAASVLFLMIENKKNKPEWRKYSKYQSHKSIKFIIAETTRGSNKDSFYYEAISVALKNPVTLNIGGEEITYTRKIVVKKHINASASY
uniref:Uncharacterized protein n=1 Tax=viral metagenome TaxID=1070528 RepID=A0A6C0BE41_9ZZZZ